MGHNVNNTNDLETQNANSVLHSVKRIVNFNLDLKVILVPSRGEYRCAGLCPILWWSSSDFFSFQQSAHSEVRLLSAFENIGGKEARKKLYQPNHQCSSDFEVLENMCATTDDYYLSDEENDDASDVEEASAPLNPEKDDNIKSETVDPSPRIIIKTAFHKVSSLDCISASLRHNELASEQNSPNLSPKNQSSASKTNLRDFEDRAEDFHLQLCVPLAQPTMLNMECGSSGRSRKSKKQMSTTTIALCSTFLLVVFVLVDRYGPSYLSKVS